MRICPTSLRRGTPAIGEAIALGAAVDYLQNIGMDKIYAYEKELSSYLLQRMLEIPEIQIYGPLHHRAALVAFAPRSGFHANDVAEIMDQSGVAIRSGASLYAAVASSFGITGTARASLYFYNTLAEIDEFMVHLKDAIAFFKNIGA
jgi:cysteine desulfurase/selenocysteine lyase